LAVGLLAIAVAIILIVTLITAPGKVSEKRLLSGLVAIVPAVYAGRVIPRNVYKQKQESGSFADAIGVARKKNKKLSSR
jgi:hypothetical protein